MFRKIQVGKLNNDFTPSTSEVDSSFENRDTYSCVGLKSVNGDTRRRMEQDEIQKLFENFLGKKFQGRKRSNAVHQNDCKYIIDEATTKFLGLYNLNHLIVPLALQGFDSLHCLKLFTTEDLDPCDIPKVDRKPLLDAIEYMNDGGITDRYFEAITKVANTFVECVFNQINRRSVVTAKKEVHEIQIPRYIPNTRTEKGGYVLAEIITSEEKYVYHLQIFWKVYVTSIKHNYPQFTSHPRIALLLSSLKQLTLISEQFLKDIKVNIGKLCIDEDGRYFAENLNACVGAIFTKFSSLFRLYSEYSNEYEAAYLIMKTFFEKKDFKQLLLSCDSQLRALRSDVTGNMSSFLIMPVQRVPRYSLLLRELKRQTPVDHLDYTLVDEALSFIGQTSDHIDLAIAERNSQEQLFQLQKLFSSDVVIAVPGRKLLHDGRLTRITRRGKHREYTFHLLSDCLMYSSLIAGGRSGDRLVLHHMMSVACMQVKPIDSSDSNEIGIPTEFSECGIHIFSKEKSFAVYAESKCIASEWLQCLSSAIGSLQPPEKSDLSMCEKDNTATSQRLSDNFSGIWMSNKTSSNCVRCNSLFSMFNRRHHCRKCGDVVCNTCSDYRIQIHRQQNRAQRVCATCYAAIKEKQLRSFQLHLKLHNIVMNNIDKKHIRLYILLNEQIVASEDLVSTSMKGDECIALNLTHFINLHSLETPNVMRIEVRAVSSHSHKKVRLSSLFRRSSMKSGRNSYIQDMKRQMDLKLSELVIDLNAHASWKSRKSCNLISNKSILLEFKAHVELSLDVIPPLMMQLSNDISESLSWLQRNFSSWTTETNTQMTSNTEDYNISVPTNDRRSNTMINYALLQAYEYLLSKCNDPCNNSLRTSIRETIKHLSYTPLHTNADCNNSNSNSNSSSNDSDSNSNSYDTNEDDDKKSGDTSGDATRSCICSSDTSCYTVCSDSRSSTVDSSVGPVDTNKYGVKSHIALEHTHGEDIPVEHIYGEDIPVKHTQEWHSDGGCTAVISRRNIIETFIRSESIYVTMLEDALEVVIEPLESVRWVGGTSIQLLANKKSDRSLQQGITEANLLVFLQSFKQIFALNSEFKRRLDDITSTTAGNTFVGDIGNKITDIYIGNLMEEFVPLLQLYQEFVRCHSSAMFVLLHSEFSSIFHRPVEVDNTLSYQDILNLPLTRITKYSCFINKLLVETPHDHIDFTSINISRKVLDHIENDIDQIYVKSKSLHQLSLIESNIKGIPLSLADNPDRRLLREGVLTKLSRTKSKQSFVFYLFTDMLLYCFENTKFGHDSIFFDTRRSLIYKRTVYPKEAICDVDLDTIDGVQDKYKTLKNAFVVLGVDKSFILIAPSASAMQLWVNDIKVTIENLSGNEVNTV